MNKELRTNFWKTARDPLAPLVAPTSESLGRLGALVFQPDATEKSYWADAWLGIQTRIAGSAAGFEGMLTRGRENVFQVRGQLWVYAPQMKIAFREWLLVTRARHQPEALGQREVIVPGATAVQALHPTDAKTAKPQSHATLAGAR